MLLHGLCGCYVPIPVPVPTPASQHCREPGEGGRDGFNITGFEVYFLKCCQGYSAGGLCSNAQASAQLRWCHSVTRVPSVLEQGQVAMETVSGHSDARKANLPLTISKTTKPQVPG